MILDLDLKEEGLHARGRNGYFKPKSLTIHDAVEGSVSFHVGSKRAGDTEPVMVRLTKKGLKQVIGLFSKFLSKEDQKALPPVDVVVTLKDGLVDLVEATRHGVKVYIVDKDGQMGSPTYRRLKVTAPLVEEVEEFNANAYGVGEAVVDPENVGRVVEQINDPGTVWDSCPVCALDVLMKDKVAVNKRLAVCPPCFGNR